MASHDLHTFRDLQLGVLRWIDEEADTDTTLQNVKDAINRSHRRLLTSRTWPFMQWPVEESLTTVSGTRTYALKPGMQKILTLWDVTRKEFYPLIPRREWEAVGTNRTDLVRPVGAVYGDIWPVKQQPTAGTLSIVSSSASDTTPTVQLTGLDADGEYVSETRTATGTSPSVTSASFSFILSVTKTGTWVGTMTLKDSAGATLLTLLPAVSSKQYPTLDFTETPDGAYPFTYTAQRLPSTLVLDGDVPDTPYPFSEIHLWDALIDLTTYNTELGNKELSVWTARRDELMKALEESVDESILGSRPRFIRNMEPTRHRVIGNITW